VGFMALVTVSGVNLPAPTEFQIGYFDISKAERNASGKMIIERIATKTKLFLTYAYLTREDMAKILTVISSTSYTVTYFDAQNMQMRSGVFYCGDRQLGFLDYFNGVPRYKDFTFNLIEL
jgi:hypothetical protein